MVCNPLISNIQNLCSRAFSSLSPVLEVIDFKRFRHVKPHPYVLHTYEPALWGDGLKRYLTRFHHPSDSDFDVPAMASTEIRRTPPTNIFTAATPSSRLPGR